MKEKGKRTFFTLSHYFVDRRYEHSKINRPLTGVKQSLEEFFWPTGGWKVARSRWPRRDLEE